MLLVVAGFESRSLSESDISDLVNKDTILRYLFSLVIIKCFFSSAALNKLSLDDMYTDEELDLMNGAHLEVEAPAPVERQKREVTNYI